MRMNIKYGRRSTLLRSIFSFQRARNQRLLRSYYVLRNLLNWMLNLSRKHFFFFFRRSRFPAASVVRTWRVHAHTHTHSSCSTMRADYHANFIKIYFHKKYRDNHFVSNLFDGLAIMREPYEVNIHTATTMWEKQNFIFGAFVNDDNFDSAVTDSALLAATPTSITWKWLIKKVFCPQRQRQRKQKKIARANCRWKIHWRMHSVSTTASHLFAAYTLIWLNLPERIFVARWRILTWK